MQGDDLMPGIVDFLTARLDEDEQVAQQACDGTNGRWRITEQAYDQGRRIEADDPGWFTIYDEGGHDERQAAHIARHDPARVLAEVKAKRRMLELTVEMINDEEFRTAGTTLMCNLAAPYDQHPDYDPVWRVE